MSESSQESNPGSSESKIMPTPSAATNLGASVQQLGAAAADVGQSVQEGYEQLAERTKAAIRDRRQKVIAWQKDLNESVREKPVKSLLIAVAVGFVLAAITVD